MRRFEGDGDAWDDALFALGASDDGLVPHVLQSSAWGDFKSRWGWDVHRFTWGEHGRPTAAIQVLVRRVGGLPVSIGYAPRGPLVTAPSTDAAARWRSVLADVLAWARTMRLAHVKIDADVASERADIEGAWRAAGFGLSREQIQFPNTMLSDLGGGEEAALAAMKPKTRYNVRLAGRRGVSVRRGTEADLAGFMALYRETSSRQGFAIRADEYYLDIWRVMMKAGHGTMILAEHQGRALAGVLPVSFGTTAWYLWGASSDQERDRMAAYAAQWESLRWAIERGCERYDWWGGPTLESADDSLTGVGRFKAGFGARLEPQLGAWDATANIVSQAAYRSLSHVRRLWLARRRAKC